jgi:SAM-dependent methyltransferase
MRADLDRLTVEGFGREWATYDQSAVPADELDRLFEEYFWIFPWDDLPAAAVGCDIGCGSGRWAARVAPRVGRLHCVDASPRALEVAAKTLERHTNCVLHHAGVENLPFEDESMDFGYSLGVLHHVSDTLAGLRACVQKLKPGAPFLLYLYYAFDNRPWWYRPLWRISDRVHRLISILPHRLRVLLSSLIALVLYWPLARVAFVLDRFGVRVEGLPLAVYRDRSLYTMRTDALDRFGTRFERRFTRVAMLDLMRRAGLEHIELSDAPPFWCAVARRAGSAQS